jgi:hypothetical protein
MGCSSSPQPTAADAMATQDPPDPFGWSAAVARSPSKDLSMLLAHCPRQGGFSEQYNPFGKPCQLKMQGITLKFDRYFLDARQRIVAVSGMHPDPETVKTIRALLANQNSARYAGVCIRWGHATLPEFTIASKDQCDALSYNII